jgi:hypothetical protein
LIGLFADGSVSFALAVHRETHFVRAMALVRRSLSGNFLYQKQHYSLKLPFFPHVAD